MENNNQLKNNQILNNELKVNKIEIKELYQLYKNEFIISCESILIENQNDFLDNFYDKMNLIIKNEYGENIFEKNTSLYLSKKQCENNFVTDIYWPMRNLCSSALKKYSEKLNKSKNFLVNFRPHCIYDQVPLHTCGSKFIQIFEDENNKKKVLYVACPSCNKCYYSNCIRMNCHYCQIDFYSEIINYQTNLFPATWKEYHCNNKNILTNEQMHCINCNKLLYIKNNKLYCKKCREIFDPKSIIWTCIICNQDFKSDIKIYNPLEFKEIEIAKRDAVLYKKVVKPNYLPCNCISKYDIDNYSFVHEQNGKCKGLLYYSYINNKEYLICSLCNKIYDLNQFQWKCPICFKKFTTNELRFCEYEKNNNKHNIFFQRVSKNYFGKKINNSNSQKIINVNENDKTFNKNNSYIKKRINSSFTSKNNTMNNSFEKNEDNNKITSYKNKNKKELSIILNTDNNNKSNNLNNIANNNSNKENNSITNKYNIGSTAHSSHLNNNNIKQPQEARKLTDPYFSNNKINSQNKDNIKKYINEKILNIPFSTNSKINNNNNNNSTNTNKKLNINNSKPSKPYRTIEEYINNFNYNEINNNNNNNNYLNTSFKNESNKSENNGYINIKKFQNNKRDNSFCENSNKSFISQKTDMKINQVYVPKKHLHRASAPTTPLYKNKEKNYYYNNFNMNENKEKNNNYDSIINKNNHLNHSYEKRNIRNINISNINDKNLNENIQKLRELSGPKIYPIIKKNIFIGINNNNKINNKNSMIQQKTNINNINNIDKSKMLNNHRNYTNMYQNSFLNNKLNSTTNSNNSYYVEKDKNKYKSNRNTNLEKKNNKKNVYTNRNINYYNENNYKNKGLGTTSQKLYSNLLNSSVDGINNIQNINLNKNYITNHPKNNNNIKKENKKENNDNILSKYKKIINKEILSGKKANNHNRNTKKIGMAEYTNSNNKAGTLTKNIIKNNNNNNINSSNKKKFNKNNNKIIKTKEKEEIQKKEKIDLDEKETLKKDKNENENENENNDTDDTDELKSFNFDAYKIITQLGQGSFGKIYLVQNSNNELFTMKKLVYSEELDVQTVLKEYKMCYKLKHPNIVKILGIYSNKLDKTTYVVYVLMEVGLTDWEKEIKNHIEKRLYYTESELIQIMKQIINVLSFLQKQNISHRDIKPQNILVFKNNIYKVADFGEAKQIENMTINLACNSLRGTELYMSPLLFNGLRTGQVDIRHNVFRSDVYSLGLCILFAGSLEMMSLYDIRKYVEMDDVKNYLDKMFNDKYSKKFIDLLSSLLEIHESKRPDFIDLEKIMKEW